MPAAIATERLTKCYGSTRAVVDLDLEVEQGEVFGFLGPNGAGKTTTIRVLLDFLRPTSGTASVLGLDSRRDSVAIHRRVGYLAGDLALPERLTGRDLIDWLERLRGAADATSRDQLVERFGVELDRPIRELSKGNRQKIGLLQALMHRPEVLILDEPTAGLDPLMQEEFRVVVREAAAEGRCVFLSSHSLDEVERAADRVGVIREGRLVAVSSVDELHARSVRHVEIRFASPVDAAGFAALPGVRDVVADTATVHMTVAGELDAVVKEAAKHPVRDLLSQPADLEEIFLGFYRDAIEGDGDA